MLMLMSCREFTAQREYWQSTELAWTAHPHLSRTVPRRCHRPWWA